MGHAAERKGGYVARYTDPGTGSVHVVPGSPVFPKTKAGRKAAKEHADTYEESLGATAILGFNPATTTVWMFVNDVYYADKKKVGRPQPHVLDNYLVEMRRFIEPYAIAKMLVTQIKEKDVRDWWDEIQADFMGKLPSQLGALRMMRVVVNHAWKKGVLWSVENKYLSPTAQLDVDPGIAKAGRQARKTKDRLSEEDYEQVLEGPAPKAHLMWIETAGESGCRPEEIMALVPEQFIWSKNELHVRRSVIYGMKKKLANEVNDGQTAMVHDQTKDHEDRHLPMPPAYMAKMKAWIEEEGIGDGELIFSRKRMGVGMQFKRMPYVDLSQAPDEYVTAANGRRYRHGGTNCYDIAKCKCYWCTAAVRQRKWKEQPAVGSDGRVYFVDDPARDICYLGPWLKRFRAAFAQAGVVWKTIEPYDMRHAHAVWLSRDPKMTVEELMNRLGHEDYATTKGYIDEARPLNSQAVANRNRRYEKEAAAQAPVAADPQARMAELLAEMQSLMGKAG